MPRGRFGAPRDPVTGRYVSTPKQFAAELFEKAAYTPRGLVDVVDESAERVVTMAKANVRRTAPIHNAGAYKGIDHEVNEAGSDVWAEVGYNYQKYRPARLGNLLEFGGGGDHSPPHWDLALALSAEADRFEHEIADYGEALLLSRFDPNVRGPDPRKRAKR